MRIAQELWTRGFRPLTRFSLSRSFTSASSSSSQPHFLRTAPFASALKHSPRTLLESVQFSGLRSRPISFSHSRRPLFDPRFFLSRNASQTLPPVLPVLSPPPVAGWLIFSSVLVFGVIVVGGVTRLTESGLSITEWRPITGIVPPLSEAQWNEEFDKYKITPEFKL